jgi:hypothetical protein
MFGNNAEVIKWTRTYLEGIGLRVTPPPPYVGVYMPRYAARRDTTHADVRDGLREAGYSVFDAGGVGNSFPDLVVGAHGMTFLIEVKSPGGEVSDGQSKFAANWRGGPVAVVYSLEQALAVIIKHVRGDKPVPMPTAASARRKGGGA